MVLIRELASLGLAARSKVGVRVRQPLEAAEVVLADGARAQRLRPLVHLLEQELNVKSFDTGFPVDFATLRENLGDDVTIYGGPRTEFLKDATPAEITAETRRILGSGILDTGRFVLREANNMAPGTPIENIEAMYYAGRRYGVLTKTGERC